MVPAILFSTLRFGLIGATTANLLTALFTSSFVLWNIGEPVLSRSDSSERILAMQVLLAFTSLWCLPIAALLTERDRLLGDLSLANAQLKTESETKSHLVTACAGTCRSPRKGSACGCPTSFTTRPVKA